MIEFSEKGIVDVNKEIALGNIVRNEEEQRGARANKFWFNNYSYLYKDVYSKSYEDYAEVIASKLAHYLGIECANYCFAKFNENSGVITESLVKDIDNEDMLSGTEIITSVYTDFIFPKLQILNEYQNCLYDYDINSMEDFLKLSNDSKKKMYDKIFNAYCALIRSYGRQPTLIQDFTIENTRCIFETFKEANGLFGENFIEMKNGIIKSNNLYDIWYVLEKYAEINRLEFDVTENMNSLINMFIFDIITSQGDRHADNWSIIVYNNKTMRLSPLYDNSGICALNREKAVKNILDYTMQLSGNMHERKKQKIAHLLDETINHSKSGLKVDLDDVSNKSKNKQLIDKYLSHTSEEFLIKLESTISKLNEGTLNILFAEVESENSISIPEIVKTAVVTTIMNNKAMIEESMNKEKGKHGK